MKYQDANQRNDTKNNQIELTNKKNIDDIEDLLDKGRISYDKAFYLAKISLELEKYEDSIRYVEEMVKLNETEFSDEERDVFITAFRFLISEKRRAWRISNKKEEEAKNASDKIFLPVINEIRVSIETLIQKICEKFIHLVNNYLLKKTESPEGKIILITMKADHYRYMAEITNGDQFATYKNYALEFYKEAYEKSLNLPHLNKIRLGTCLNYSVFYFEIMSDPIIALKIATKVLDDALKELKNVSDENLDDEVIKDSLKVIDIIKMNVNEWFQEVEKEENRKF